jgi:amino-acid N-acetyltransferase
MQKALNTDVADIKKLLQENDLPISDISSDMEFYIEIENKQISVVGGLEIIGDFVIIRSIAVAHNYKGKGLGTKMTHHLIDTAKKKKYDIVYLLTMTAENYFPKFGFTEINRESAPEAIKNSSQFTTVCPDSAVLMGLRIN